MIKSPLNHILGGLLAGSVALGAAAQDGQWSYTTGVDYSSGDYGGDPIDTDILYVPFSAAYETGNWKFKATVPWVEIEGPGTVVGAGDGGVVVGNPDNLVLTETSESGLGDIWLSATYQVDAVPAELFYLDLTGKVKLPTADEDDGLGTGETDYTFQADIFKPLGGNVTPFATVAYKVKGDPSGFELDNVFYLSGGLDYGVTEETNIGASLDFQEATTDTSEDRLELFAYLNRDLDQRWSVTFYGYKGLEDGSPDYGGGVQIKYTP